MPTDAGIISVLLAAITAATVMIAGALGSLAVLTRVHAQSDAAADLAALAAANTLLTETDPCAIARDVAERNSAVLESCAITGAVASVWVSVEIPAGLRFLTDQGHLTSQAAAELMLRPVR